MKNPADMLASDLRRMAGAIPAGWRAAVLMALLVVVFPLILFVLVVDALTYDMPVLRASMKNVLQRIGGWMHHGPGRLRELQQQQQAAIRHAH